MITPSGGLVYHARALRGHDLWFPTRRLVSRWLETWLLSVKPEHLIVFGPSAGYLFEPGCFHSPELKRLTIVEPDILAKPLFHLRHLRSRRPHPDNRPSVTWHLSSKLLPHTSRRETDFADFLSEASISHSGKTAVFFAGLLGQLEFHRESFRREELLARRVFLEALKPIPWASLHDLESKTLTRATAATLNSLSTELPIDVLLNQTLRIQWVEEHLQQPTDWVDHATDWLGAPTRAAHWRITPKRLHVLGFVQTFVDR